MVRYIFKRYEIGIYEITIGIAITYYEERI